MQPFVRYLSRWAVGAVLAAAVLLLQTGSASAAPQYLLGVEFELNGVVQGSPDTTPITNPSTQLIVQNVSINHGEFLISLTAAMSNSNGTPSDATLNLTNVFITTGPNYKKGDTLTVLASAQGYLQPVSPPDLTINVGGSGLSLAGSPTFSYGGGAAESDALFSTASASVFSSFTGSAATLPNISTPFDAISTPYSLTTEIGVSFGASGGFLTQDSANLDAAVPVPAGLVLALTGLPVVGLGWLRRRRLKRA